MSPQALVATIVWTAGLYLTLWLLPEPTTKLLAAGMTLALLAWLPAATLSELMDGWARLMHEVDRATSFAQVQEASERFSRVMGENTARVLVLVVTAALTGSAVKLSRQLPKLPGFARAAARAEAQGASLTEAGQWLCGGFTGAVGKAFAEAFEFFDSLVDRKVLGTQKQLRIPER